MLAAENKGVARVLSAAGVNIAVGLIFYVHNFLRGRKFCDREYWRFALAFNLPLIPHYLSQIVLSQSDRLMINAYCGTGKAGIYSVAFSAAMIMNIVVNGINASLVPWTYQKLQEGKRREIGKMCSGLLLVVAAGVWLVVMAAPEAVALLAPAEYREAIWVIPPLAVNVFLIFQYSLFANIEFYYEENKFIMLASTLAAVMNIGLNALFIPRFGYLAAGYTSFACYLIYCAAHYAFMRKVCRKHMQGKKVYNSYVLLGITLGLFLLCAAAMALYSLPLIRYGVVLLVLAAAAIRWKKLMDILRRLRSRR